MTTGKKALDHDWRLHATSTLAEPWTSPWTGQHFGVGTRITLTSIVRYRGNKTIAVPIPNATAMFLSLSACSFGKAKEIIEGDGLPKSIKKELHFKTEERAIDYIENVCAAFVFAYSALEAFANESIPDTYEYKTQRQDKRCLETYSKEQIERNVSLDTKLSVILPEILAVKSPKGSSRIWEDFKQLGDLRDRIIHMKSGDRKSSGPDEQTIWNAIFASVSPPHQIAKEVLNFFLKPKGALPTWLEHAPA